MYVCGGIINNNSNNNDDDEIIIINAMYLALTKYRLLY